MKKVTFNLLEKSYPEDKKGLGETQVLELRAEARRYREMNNKLVKKIWAIDQKIALVDDEKSRKPLIKNKEKLIRQIEEEKYIEKLKHLLDEINTLEIALVGRSNVGGRSPYTL